MKCLLVLLIFSGHALSALVSSNLKSCDTNAIGLTSGTAILLDGNLTSCLTTASPKVTEVNWALTPQVNSSTQVKVTVQGVTCSATTLEVFSDMGCIDPHSKQECPLVNSVPGQSTNSPQQFSCFFKCSCSLACTKLYTRVYPQQDGKAVEICDVSLVT